MTITRFEEIIAWQKARVLTNEIYQLFSSSRDYGFRDQIMRAVISIMNNIAEGFERKGNKEFKNFLFIAKGSCGEVRSMLYIARDRDYISVDVFNNLLERAIEISRLLSGLVKTL